jgi:hypothetical protein
MRIIKGQKYEYVDDIPLATDTPEGTSRGDIITIIKRDGEYVFAKQGKDKIKFHYTFILKGSFVNIKELR